MDLHNHAGYLVLLVTWQLAYPLLKCVVHSAEVYSAHTAQGSVCANEVAAESATCDEGVDRSLAIDSPLSYKGVDGHMTFPTGQEVMML